MKKMLMAALLVAAVSACGSRSEAPGDLNGRWQVQQIAGASLGEGVEIWFEIDAQTGAIRGYTGCNDFTATLSAFGETLAVGAITEADAACPNDFAATDEARFLGVLPSVQRRIRRGDSLELLPMTSGSETLVRARLME